MFWFYLLINMGFWKKKLITKNNVNEIEFSKDDTENDLAQKVYSKF